MREVQVANWHLAAEQVEYLKAMLKSATSNKMHLIKV